MDSSQSPLSAVLDNLYTRYLALQQSVNQVLQAAVGDSSRINLQVNAVDNFTHALNLHRHLFPAATLEAVHNNLSQFRERLFRASVQSSDPAPHSPFIVPGASSPSTGRRGRPAAHIDEGLLRHLTASNYGPAEIARFFGRSTRTITRRQESLGLREPGKPPQEFTYVVCTDTQDKTLVVRHNTHRPRLSDLSDLELDGEVSNILRDHPRYGRTMLMAALRTRGHRVPRTRVEQSYLRVFGPPRVFGSREIVRRSYYVPGANSLWHHDGNHNLIRWKFVIHGFVDGKSRAVPGMRVSNNNRALTVLQLFLDSTEHWGVPSRLRGDHGVENVLVASWMERYRGVSRGSYIWGRSVHNTRVERLWLDVGQGFSNKWKIFFHDLENHYGLDVDNNDHIWLIHLLFHLAIELDCLDWTSHWNDHKISTAGHDSAPGSRSSPRQMWLYSQLTDGMRGFEHLQAAPDPSVSPDMLQDLRNRRAAEVDSPIAIDARPDHMNYVQCDPPNNPFTPAQLGTLQTQLALQVDLQDKTMSNRRLVWIHGLRLMNTIRSAM